MRIRQKEGKTLLPLSQKLRRAGVYLRDGRSRQVGIAEEIYGGFAPLIFLLDCSSRVAFLIAGSDESSHASPWVPAADSKLSSLAALLICPEDRKLPSASR